jgi:hypothetical protein
MICGNNLNNSQLVNLEDNFAFAASIMLGNRRGKNW